MKEIYKEALAIASKMEKKFHEKEYQEFLKEVYKKGYNDGRDETLELITKDEEEKEK